MYTNAYCKGATSLFSQILVDFLFHTNACNEILFDEHYPHNILLVTVLILQIV